MKKLLLLLILLPQLALAAAHDDFGYFQFNGDSQAYISEPSTVGIGWQVYNNTYAVGDAFYQLRIWLDDYNSIVCSDVQGPVVFTAPDYTDSVFDLSAYSTINELDVISDSDATLDGDGCLTSPTYEYFYSSDSDVVGEIILGVPEGATTYVQPSVNNATLDWFLGFLIFFICMVFPIWLFRRK